jgi:hypothetical protein
MGGVCTYNMVLYICSWPTNDNRPFVPIQLKSILVNLQSCINSISTQNIHFFLFVDLLLFVVQLSLKTEREKKREKYFPMRKYAIKA